MIHYVEFDTTSLTLQGDLETRILQCTDWSRLGANPPVLTTTTQQMNPGTGAVDVVSTAGLSAGMVVSFGSGATRETRVLTVVTAGQIQFEDVMGTHAVGTEVRLGNVILKATTTRGADMIVDLAGAGSAPFTGLGLATYVTHDGTTGTGKQLKYVQWRYSSWTTSIPLHVVLSVSKEHIFFSIEGPRPGEAGTASAQYGSFRNYFFLCDLVPYDEEDVTPVVVSGGATLVAVASSVANSSHVAHTSRNLDNTTFWSPGRLASLQVPCAGDAGVLNVQRQRELDDRYILTPYVLFSDADGMRGRLGNIFFAGFNQSTEFSVSPPPIGARVQYQGLWYRLVAVSKGDGNRAAWGPLGAVSNETSNNFQRSVVVGVPCLP